MASQDHRIHSFEEYVQKEVITFSRLWEEHTQEKAQLIIRENKMGAAEDQDFTSQSSTLSDEEYE